MNDLVGRNCDFPPTTAKLNKAKLHTDINTHIDTDTDRAPITSESTGAEHCKKGLKPLFHSEDFVCLFG